MWSDLPQEILNEILLKLPVKTLIKCTTLSKKFYSSITHPEFIAAHIKNNNNTHLLLRYLFEDDDEICKVRFLIEPDDDNFSGFDDERALEFPFGNFRKGWYNVLGSINGVICLVNDLICEGTLLVLWNPSIKKYVELPRPSYLFQAVGGYESASGFLFDHISNDYKVVRVVDVGPEFYKPKVVEIFSLRSGCWRDLGSFDVCYRLRGIGCALGYQSCSVHSCVYWVASDPNGNVIIKFDAATEGFEVLELPSCLKAWKTEMLELLVQDFRGVLGLVHRDFEAYTCSVWVMKECGVSNSWTKIINLSVLSPHPPAVPRALTLLIRKSEEIIMVKGGAGSFRTPMSVVVAVDQKQGTERALGEINGEGRLFYLSTYVESMALFVEGKGLADGAAQ